MKIQLKKFQNGGAFAPFLASYTPTLVNDTVPDPVLTYLASIGNPAAATTSSTSSKSSKSDSVDVKDTMELLKNMKGLDNDVAAVSKSLIQQAQADKLFGTGDPVVQYYKNLDLVNKVLESKEEFSKAYDQAKAQGALSEAAISSDGKIVVKTSKGNYNLVTPDKALIMQSKGIAQIQRNQDLLNDRKSNAKMAFQNGVLNIVQNGVSFKSVSEVINAIASNLGSSTTSQEGYSTKEGNQISQGIAALKNAGVGSMNGVYKVSLKNTTQEAQAKMAVDAIYRNLNEAQKAYLKLNSNGTDSGAYGLIKEIVMGKTSSTQELHSEYQKNMDSLGNAKSSKTDENGNPISKIDTDSAARFGLGYGDHATFQIRGKGQTGIDVQGRSIAMQDKEGHPLSISSLEELGNGRLGGMMQNLNSITMDGALISPDAVSKVMIDGGRVYSADLPVDQEALQKGIVRPDYKILQKIEAVNDKLGSLKAKDQQDLTPAEKNKINQIYQANGIAAKYDSNGNLTAPYRRFILINGTTTEKAFVGDPEFTIDPGEANDQARENYQANIRKHSGDDKFKLDSGWFGLGDEKVYQGTIAIPMSSNYNDIYQGSGIKLDNSQFHAAEAAQQRRDYLMSRYNNPGSLVQ